MRAMESMAQKKIVVADDHPVVLEGMKLLFANRDDLHLVGTALTLEEAETICAKEGAHLLILDINFQGKNSLDFIERFKLRFPQLNILIFSSYDSPGIVKRALKCRIDGYVLKDAPSSEWMEAVDTIFSGKSYISNQLAPSNSIKDSQFSKNDGFYQAQSLSSRELEIIQCIVEGKKEYDIGQELSISKNTVHSHKKNILKKLGLHSNSEIVKFAYENNLIH